MSKYFATGMSVLGLLCASQAYAHQQDHNDWQGWEGDATPVTKTVLDFLIEPTYAQATISVEGNYRVIRSDGLPDHDTGRFPNRNNPNAIDSQDNTYRVPLKAG